MNKNRRFSSVLLLLCIVLIAATALMISGCNPEPAASVPETPATTTTAAPPVYEARGEGTRQFYLTVKGPAGETAHFDVHTDKTTVGEALLALGLIEGEEGAYGLYVKTVNGVTVDYATHGKYWAFYENGEYALAGVDSTDIVDGTTYELRAES